MPKTNLSPENVRETLEKVIREQFEVKQGDYKDGILDTVSFESDLGADSLDAVEFIMAVEEAFDIEIPDDEAEKLTTVGACYDYLTK